MDIIKDNFDSAVDVIQSLPKEGTFQPSQDLILTFYGYYKQATIGQCNIKKPSFWDLVGKAKWEAWNKLGNMSKEDAMISYVNELKKIVEVMPHTEKVEIFLSKVGDFFEIIDDENNNKRKNSLYDQDRDFEELIANQIIYSNSLYNNDFSNINSNSSLKNEFSSFNYNSCLKKDFSNYNSNSCIKNDFSNFNSNSCLKHILPIITEEIENTSHRMYSQATLKNHYIVSDSKINIEKETNDRYLNDSNSHSLNNYNSTLLFNDSQLKSYACSTIESSSDKFISSEENKICLKNCIFETTNKSNSMNNIGSNKISFLDSNSIPVNFNTPLLDNTEEYESISSKDEISIESFEKLIKYNPIKTQSLPNIGLINWNSETEVNKSIKNSDTYSSNSDEEFCDTSDILYHQIIENADQLIIKNVQPPCLSTIPVVNYSSPIIMSNSVTSTVKPLDYKLHIIIENMRKDLDKLQKQILELEYKKKKVFHYPKCLAIFNGLSYSTVTFFLLWPVAIHLLFKILNRYRRK